MAGITRFEEIDAWKTSRELTNKIYPLGNQTGFNVYLESNPRKRRVSDDDSNYEV